METGAGKPCQTGRGKGLWEIGSAWAGISRLEGAEQECRDLMLTSFSGSVFHLFSNNRSKGSTKGLGADLRTWASLL